MSLDPYKMLGVDKNADASAVKSAYRKLARKYHPDVNPGDQAAEDKFKEIAEAYDILSDSDKKNEYDNLGREAFYEKGFGGTGYQRPDFNQGGFSFSDIFGDLFGGGAQGDQQNRNTNFSYNRGFGNTAPPRKGESVNFKQAVSLLEAAIGTEIKLELNITQPCSQCQGQGLVASDGGVRNCPRCGGQGRISHPKSLKVQIPAGIKDGQKVRLRGKGSPGENGGDPGDILLEVTIKPHPVFTRKERNIYADVPVSLYHALLGGTVQVATLTGRAQLTVPPGTQNGTRMRLKGQGMPATKKEDAGDFYVTVKITLPIQLNDEAKELVAKLAEVAPLVPPEGS